MATNFKILRALTNEDKLAPQGKVVLSCIETAVKAGKGAAERKAILAEMEKAQAAGTLETKQGLGTLLSFYQTKLSDMKVISMERVKAEAKAPAKAA